SYPPDMEGSDNGQNTWTLNVVGSVGIPPNFIYVSVIPKGFQSRGGEIYNYNTPDTETLLAMAVGRSQALHSTPDLAKWFTYTREPDTVVGGHAAATYVNGQPWEA